jgi:outer membrane receptor protein involved in Fe transport
VTTGAIAGTVTSDQHQPIEGVQVQVTNRTTGFSSRVTTRTDGRYTVPGLDVGNDYAVTIRRIGFQPQTRENVVVVLSQVTRLDFELVTQAAQLAAVTVVGNQDPVMSASHTGATTTISDTALRRLPSLNRSFYDFVALTPQVSTVGPGLSGGGTNNRYNNIQIDGSTEADLFGLGSTGQPGGQANGKSISLEAVKEYQVLLSPYDVRQANFSGLLVNAVTKSGTNDWHGSLVGVSRNQGMTRSQAYITKFDQSQGAFSLGGPIMRDKVLFFVAGDWQARTTPASGPYVGSALSGPSQATVDQVNSALGTYGMPIGSGALVNNGNPLANAFARLDFNLPGNTQLVIRDNYGNAVQDIFSRSASAYSLSNNGYHFKSKKNAAVAQLRTLFSGGSFNELLLNYETIRDRRQPSVIAPQVTVFNSGFGIIDGSERFSQGNQLDQDLIELTDNYTLPIGAHRITFGATGQWYKVRNLFTQASYGVWTFGTLDSLNQGIARQYIIGVPLSGDGAVRFRAGNYGAYVQDEYAATDRLSITYGIRLDDPIFFTKPPLNASVLSEFGRNTQLGRDRGPEESTSRRYRRVLRPAGLRLAQQCVPELGQRRRRRAHLQRRAGTPFQRFRRQHPTAGLLQRPHRQGGRRNRPAQQEPQVPSERPSDAGVRPPAHGPLGGHAGSDVHQGAQQSLLSEHRPGGPAGHGSARPRALRPHTIQPRARAFRSQRRP